MNNYFIKNLRFLTKTTINQNQLAKKLGISRQTVTSLLKTQDPRSTTLLKLSEIYHVSIDDLLKKDLESEYLKEKM